MTDSQPGASPSCSASEYRQMLEWYASSDTGMSSKALASAAFGLEAENNFYPLDPADLGRCLRLIRRLPFVERGLAVLAQRCPVWKAYAEHWDELRETMDAEVGLDWQKGRYASATYKRMRAIQDASRPRGRATGQFTVSSDAAPAA